MSNVEVLDASPRPPASSVSSLLRPLDLGEFLKPIFNSSIYQVIGRQ
jgi:hypothetical protein